MHTWEFPPKEVFMPMIPKTGLAILLLALLILTGRPLDSRPRASAPPKSKSVCSGFWIYHPWIVAYKACRDPSHGYEYPLIKQEVLAWEQASGVPEPQQS